MEFKYPMPRNLWVLVTRCDVPWWIPPRHIRFMDKERLTCG
jgi:hypothetical protein